MITLDSLQKVKPLWRGDLSMNTFIELSADFVFKLYISEGSVYLQTELWHNTTTFSNLKIDWNWSFTQIPEEKKRCLLYLLESCHEITEPPSIDCENELLLK